MLGDFWCVGPGYLVSAVLLRLVLCRVSRSPKWADPGRPQMGRGHT